MAPPTAAANHVAWIKTAIEKKYLTSPKGEKQLVGEDDGVTEGNKAAAAAASD